MSRRWTCLSRTQGRNPSFTREAHADNAKREAASGPAAIRPVVFAACHGPEDREVIEPVFPRAGTMLIFQFAAIYEVQEYETEQLRRSWATTVIGPIEACRTRVILHDHVKSLDVLFRPMGLYRLFGVPISPFTGGGTEAHAALGSQVSSLYQSLGNAESFGERVELMDRFFLHRLQQARPLDPTAQAIHRLASGRCNVGGAARIIGISERHFERRSLAWTGMSPETLAQVSRFKRAVQKYRSGRGSWKEIAHEVGYYDQMHLIKNFHNFGGGTPTEVIKPDRGRSLDLFLLPLTRLDVAGRGDWLSPSVNTRVGC